MAGLVLRSQLLLLQLFCLLRILSDLIVRVKLLVVVWRLVSGLIEPRQNLVLLAEVYPDLKVKHLFQKILRSVDFVAPALRSAALCLLRLQAVQRHIALQEPDETLVDREVADVNSSLALLS